jgi:hypothetical protein
MLELLANPAHVRFDSIGLKLDATAQLCFNLAQLCFNLAKHTLTR